MLLLHDGELVRLIVALEQMRAGFASQGMTPNRAKEITKVDSLVERLRAERRRRQRDADGTPRM